MSKQICLLSSPLKFTSIGITFREFLQKYFSWVRLFPNLSKIGKNGEIFYPRNFLPLKYSKKDVVMNILTKTLKCLCGIVGSNAISYAQRISLVYASIADFCVEDWIVDCFFYK